MRALPFVEQMKAHSSDKGAIMVTVLPELCLNIANAYLYDNQIQ
jgi:hypothetical protein